MGNNNLFEGADEGGRSFCPDCGSVVCWATAEEAARLSGASERMLLRWAEAGRLHLSDDGAGAPRVCLNSPLMV